MATEAVQQKTPPVEAPTEDDFSKAFAEFVKPEPATPEPVVAPPNPPEGETEEQKTAREAAEAAAGGDGTDPKSEIEGAPGEGDDPQVDPNKGKTPAPPTSSPQEQQVDPIRQLAEVLAADRAAAQQQRQAPPEPQPQAPALYTPEEQALIQTYRTDYGDVAKAEALVRRGEYAMLTTHIFKQLGDYMAPQFAMLQQIAQRVNLQQLTQDNPNYATEREAIEGWIAQQPDYLQQAYMGVMNKGTTAQVKNLFDRFRAETGATAANPGTEGIAPQGNAGKQVPARTATELSPQAKQAAQRLAPVGTKRSTVSPGEPTTFEDAFDTFAKQMANA